jgi:hypothetical protein
VVSPELALVDAELRSEALALLPEVQPFDFLERLPRTEPVELEWFTVGPSVEDRAGERSPPFLVALAAYVAGAVFRTVAFNVAVFVCITLLVLVLNLVA